MCIICAKPAKTKFPTMPTIENMWYGNPDGAGIMYAKDGKVRIEKGLMTLKDFKAKLEELRKVIDFDETPMVMHFRITTHGGTCPENTHPFPISDSVKLLQRTSLATPIGVAHNGIIPITPRKGISDTMEYIATQLAPLNRAMRGDWYRNPDALELVRNALHSKLAVLTGKGEIVTIGDFKTEDGVMYSNTSYLGWGRWGRMNTMYSWDDYGVCGMSSKSSGKKSKSKGGKKSKPTQTKSEAAAITIDKRALMWTTACDEGAYVCDSETGNVVEGEDFLIDSDNHVYIYDLTLDAAMPAHSYRAYTSQGMSLRFDESKASMEYIVKDYCPW